MRFEAYRRVPVKCKREIPLNITNSTTGHETCLSIMAVFHRYRKLAELPYVETTEK